MFVVDEVLTDEADADDDSTEVPQVEDVMRLGGRWQQARHRLLVDVHCCPHQLITQHTVLVLLVLQLCNVRVKLGYIIVHSKA